MSIADRKFGKDVTLFTVAGKNLLGQFTECTVEQHADVVDNSAVQDMQSYHRTRRTRWRITGGIAVELHTSNLMSLVGTDVAVAVTSAIQAGSGTAYTGTGILAQFKHTIADSQVCDFEIVGNGELAAGAA